MTPLGPLLPEFPVDESLIQRVLSAALDRGGDFADVYLERRHERSLRWEEGKIAETRWLREAGLGIRVVEGVRTGYAYAEDPDPATLLAAAARAARIARGEACPAAELREIPVPRRYDPRRPLEEVDLAAKVALLESIQAAALAESDEVEKLRAGFHESLSEVLVADSEGRLVRDRRPLLRVDCGVVLRRGDRRDAGRASAGGRVGLEFFDEHPAEAMGRRAVEQARLRLEAVAAPAGRMPVILAAATSGILIHEAVGHGLEADYHRQGTSRYSGRLGERVASELCTIVDDPSQVGDRGALNVDDEGRVGEATLLIEKGVLRGCMQDRLNAAMLGAATTGNGRRESYRHAPLPRMTCTYLLAGEESAEALFKPIRRGLYAKEFSGGQVDIARGDFVFDVVEGWLIEDGKLTAPVKGASLIGNGPEVMGRVDGVASDFALSPGMWTCRKQGQRVPVNVGLPHLRISEITVGGTGAGA